MYLPEHGKEIMPVPGNIRYVIRDIAVHVQKEKEQ